MMLVQRHLLAGCFALKSQPSKLRRSEASITAEDFEPLHNEPLDRPVELETEYDRYRWLTMNV